MIFEVFKDGKRMLYTESKKCMPDDQTVRLMIEAGYKPMLDGKPYKPKKKSKK